MGVAAWIGILSLALVPSYTAAVMAPQVYRDARLAAPHHVQIAIVRVTPPQTDQGKCIVSGRIERVFKGNLQVHTPIIVRLSCDGPAIGRAPRPTPPMVGGALYVATRTLQKARFLEAFLDGAPPDIVFDQAVIIGAPTTKAVCDPASSSFRC
jgi:hypothetical protein